MNSPVEIVGARMGASSSCSNGHRPASEPVMKLAQECGLTGTGLAKIFRKAEIPLPSPGYWQELQHGHNVPRPRLPIVSVGRCAFLDQRYTLQVCISTHGRCGRSTGRFFSALGSCSYDASGFRQPHPVGTPMERGYLFSTHDLHAVIEAPKARIREEIDGFPADRLLNTSSDSWVEYFKDREVLRTPVLGEEGITSRSSFRSRAKRIFSNARHRHGS